jgi:hypothetical protein
VTETLGFVVKHFRWVPHILTDVQQASRVFRVNKLFGELRSMKHHGGEFIVTSDESWFYLPTNHEQPWLRPEEEPHERPRHTVQAQKKMVTIAWNPWGFHLLNALPKGSSFTGEYYCNNILAGLLQLRPAPESRRLCLLADHARVHTGRQCQDFLGENRLRILTQPPYSPDLVPSDFVVFGHVKHCLAVAAFASRSELFEAIQSVGTEIPIETLHR